MSDNISIRVDSDKWFRLCEICDKWIVRANTIKKPRTVPDTARDRTNQCAVEGFVRVRPAREFEIQKLISTEDD